MAKKRKSRFTSLSTPGHKQDCSNYLVELVFLRQNKGKRLPAYFWRQQRYKWKYKREIQACRKFIKKYGEAKVLSVAINCTYITSWCDFARVEFELQKIEEGQRLRAQPKDTSEVEEETVKVSEDLRDFEVKRSRGGLFERLKEISGG